MSGRCIAALLLTVAALAVMAEPEIKRVRATPSGNGVELVITGSDLGNASAVWTTLAGEISISSVEDGVIRARAGGSLPPNIYFARVFGSNGVSAPAPFVVDTFTVIESVSTNTTRQQAQEITMPCAIEGVARDLGFSWFRFHVRQGQRVATETVAARIGSRLDSVLRVLDAQGREVAYSDDAPGLRCDSHAAFIAPRTGDYFIELRDVNYGGGEAFNYRMRVGDFPLVTTTFPLAVQAGTRPSLALVGNACGSATTTAELASPDRSLLPVVQNGAFVKAMVSECRELSEPEDEVLEAPCGISGQFAGSTERDVYSIRATAGEKLVIQAQTRSVGSPCDAVLELQTTKGQRLASSNVGAADEGIITHTFKDDGVYRLIVTEATGAHGPSLVYRVSITANAGFSLSVEADTVQASPGGEFEVKIAAMRRDYKGEIALALNGVSGLIASNAVVQANKTNATIKVRVPDDLDVGIVRHFEVVGRAAKEEGGTAVRASTAAALRKRWPQMLHVPFELDGPIALGIRQ